MKSSLLLVLLFSSLSLTICAQTPNPTISPERGVNQASPSPCAPPQSTLVNVSTSGIILAGFPNWIIGVVLGVAAIAFLVWFFFLRPTKAEKSKIASMGVGILAVIALLPLGGYWLGRRWANQDLQQVITDRAAVAVSLPTPTPQIIEVHDRLPPADTLAFEAAVFVNSMMRLALIVIVLVQINILLYMWLRVRGRWFRGPPY